MSHARSDIFRTHSDIRVPPHASGGKSEGGDVSSRDLADFADVDIDMHDLHKGNSAHGKRNNAPNMEHVDGNGGDEDSEGSEGLSEGSEEEAAKDKEIKSETNGLCRTIKVENGVFFNNSLNGSVMVSLIYFIFNLCFLCCIYIW